MSNQSKGKNGLVIAVITGVFVVIAALIGIIPDLIEASKPAEPVIITATAPTQSQVQPQLTIVEAEEADAPTATKEVITLADEVLLTVKPTPAVLNLSTMSEAEKTVYAYYQDLNQGEYQKAWETLSPLYIKRLINQNVESFEELYHRYELINVLSLETVDITDTHVIVKGEIVLVTLTTSKVYKELPLTTYYFMLSELNSDRWMIDETKFVYP